MRLLLLATSMLLFTSITSFAQDKTMMPAVHAGIIGPGCTNCGIMTGVGASFGYALHEKIAATVSADFYSDKDVVLGITAKTSVAAFGLSGEFYPKEALKGFFIGPDVLFITTATDLNGATIFETNDLTVGGRLGWVITIGELVKFVPYMGYGTWYDNSKGRGIFGMKVAVGL